MKTRSPLKDRHFADVDSLALFEDRLGVHLTYTGSAFYELYKLALAPLGLRPSWITALAHIQDQPRITQSALGRKMAINRASAMALCASMEAADLVERTPQSGRNQTALIISAHGNRMLERACRVEEDLTADVTRDLDEVVRALLLRSLQQINQRLAEIAT